MLSRASEKRGLPGLTLLTPASPDSPPPSARGPLHTILPRWLGCPFQGPWICTVTRKLPFANSGIHFQKSGTSYADLYIIFPLKIKL